MQKRVNVTIIVLMVVKAGARVTKPTAALETLVFNLDGTLVDSLRDMVLSLQYAFRVLGLKPPSDAAVRPFIGQPLESMVAAFSKSHIAAISAVYCEYYPKHCADHATLQPGVLEVLGTLRWRGYTLAVATNKRTDVATRLLTAVGLSPYLDFVQGADGIAHKPAPDVIYRLLLRSGERGTWLIGDTAEDIQAGKAAGLSTYAVSWGTQDAAALRRAKPDILAPNLETLLELT